MDRLLDEQPIRSSLGQPGSQRYPELFTPMSKLAKRAMLAFWSIASLSRDRYVTCTKRARTWADRHSDCTADLRRRAAYS